MNVKQKAKAFEGKIRLTLVQDSRLTLGIAEIFGECFYREHASL